MDEAVTWGALIQIVLFLLGAGVLFYLILAIANLVGILKNINKLLKKNSENIDNTLERLPEITDNVAKITDIIHAEVESIQRIMNNVGKISDSAKDAVELIKKDILVKAKNILDVIDWIKKLFEGKGKKKKEIVYRYKYKPSDGTVEEELSEKKAEDRKEEHGNQQTPSSDEDKTDSACVNQTGKQSDNEFDIQDSTEEDSIKAHHDEKDQKVNGPDKSNDEKEQQYESGSGEGI